MVHNTRKMLSHAAPPPLVDLHANNTLDSAHLDQKRQKPSSSPSPPDPHVKNTIILHASTRKHLVGESLDDPNTASSQ